jgi:hypothetical protein
MREFKNFRETKDVLKIEQPENLHIQQDDMQQAINKYGNMSRDELTEQLLSNIKTQKENGTFDKDRMHQFINTASSLMSSEQIGNLKDIIQAIDN